MVVERAYLLTIISLAFGRIWRGIACAILFMIQLCMTQPFGKNDPCGAMRGLYNPSCHFVNNMKLIVSNVVHAAHTTCGANETFRMRRGKVTLQQWHTCMVRTSP